MKLDLKDPPRTFRVGPGGRIEMKDCAHIELSPDEQITLLTESGAEYDVARKSWGFYATPSLNGRLPRFGLRGVLVKNRLGQFFVLLVEKGYENGFQSYINSEKLKIVLWLDNTHELEKLEKLLSEV